MPDGSRWDIPDAEPPPETRTPMVVREFLRRIGKRGGQMRAQRHSRAELRTWGKVRRKAAKSKKSALFERINREPGS